MISTDQKMESVVDILQGFISNSENGSFLPERISMEEKYFIVNSLEKLLKIAGSTETLTPLVRTDLLRQLAYYLKTEGKSCISTITGRFSVSDHTFKLAFPVLWPDEFEFYDSKNFGICARHKHLPNRYKYDPFCLFLGLSQVQYNHLFSSGEQIEMISAVQLKSTHGREKLVQHINHFCDYFEKGGASC